MMPMLAEVLFCCTSDIKINSITLLCSDLSQKSENANSSLIFVIHIEFMAIVQNQQHKQCL